MSPIHGGREKTQRSCAPLHVPWSRTRDTPRADRTIVGRVERKETRRRLSAGLDAWHARSRSVLSLPRRRESRRAPKAVSWPSFNPLCPPLLGDGKRITEGHPQTPGSVSLHQSTPRPPLSGDKERRRGTAPLCTPRGRERRGALRCGRIRCRCIRFRRGEAAGTENGCFAPTGLVICVWAKHLSPIP